MTTDELMNALAEPFEPSEVKWKAQAVKGNRALAVAFVDARLIQDRLDHVLGVANWQDEYTVIEGGSVVCRLSVKIDGSWITKMDVGSPSEQPDGGDRTKAAFSDALKRTAIKWGIGRYLYRLPQQWCDYDPQKKHFVGTPKLPAFALPKGAKPAAKVTANGAPPATVSSALEVVGELLASDPTIDQLNDAFKKLPPMSPADKKTAWERIKEFAESRDWEWDAKGKSFVNPKVPA